MVCGIWDEDIGVSGAREDVGLALRGLEGRSWLGPRGRKGRGAARPDSSTIFSLEKNRTSPKGQTNGFAGSMSYKRATRRGEPGEGPSPAGSQTLCALRAWRWARGVERKTKDEGRRMWNVGRWDLITKKRSYSLRFLIAPPVYIKSYALLNLLPLTYLVVHVHGL